MPLVGSPTRVESVDALRCQALLICMQNCKEHLHSIRSSDAMSMLRRVGVSCAGFTFTEVIVVMAIVSALLAYGVPNMATWIQNSRVRTAAESIENGLLLTKNEAVKRNTSVQFQLTSLASSKADWLASCVTPVGDTDGDGYADCPGAGQVPSSIQVYNSKEGGQNASVASTQSVVVFNGSGRITPPLTSPISINITNPTAGTCVGSGGVVRCLRVSVSPSGQVRLCDPSLATTDPRGC